MAWTAPASWSSGEIVTASKMNTHVRDNLNALKDYVDVFDATSVGLADDTVVGAEKTWDTSTSHYTNPSRGVVILAWLQGDVSSGGASTIRLHLEISFDGVTYSATGNGAPVDVTASASGEISSICCLRQRTGTPTGNIHIQARIERTTGSGTWTCTGGYINSLMVPTAI